MPPKFDPESGAIVPSPGQWPVPPQEDQTTRDDRLWIDGCFDFFHHGHTGVMLQSRRLGNELLVGIHSDEDIRANKGPTVMSLDERVAAVEACRFSTGVVPHAPYVTSIPWITHYGCQYVTHGDDITSDANGNDCYRYVKKAGRMKIVPRTPGISTTDLVGRMLLCTKEHFIKNLVDALDGREGKGSEEEKVKTGQQMRTRIREYAAAPNGKDSFVEVYSFKPKHRPMERRRSSVRSVRSVRANSDTTSSSSDVQQQAHRAHDTGKGVFTSLVPGVPPKPGQRIVYVDGGFDLFSSGHIAFLQTVTALEEEHGRQSGWFSEAAKAQRIKDFGSDYGPAFVIAGIHDDEVINYHKGLNYPIMNIFERGLCVTQCTYVHGIIFSAPYIPSRTYLSTLPFLTSTATTPHAVYHGPTAFMPSASPDPNDASQDPYADAKALGIFRETPRHRFQDVNSAQIVQRILDNRQDYEERQRKKGQKGIGEAAARRRELEEQDRKEVLKRREMKRQESWAEVERQFGA